MVQWESINELNACRLLDANPFVKEYYEQPLTIHYELDGETHNHYPDFLVMSEMAKELWEVKPLSDAKKPENVARTELLTAELPDLGFSYRLIVAEDLAQEPRLSNVITLLKFGRFPISPLARERIRRLFLQSGTINWGVVKCGDIGPIGRQIVCRLVLEGVVGFNIEKPWTDATILHWVSQAL